MLTVLIIYSACFPIFLHSIFVFLKKKCPHFKAEMGPYMQPWEVPKADHKLLIFDSLHYCKKSFPDSRGDA
jgi:hypothetical protein